MSLASSKAVVIVVTPRAEVEAGEDDVEIADDAEESTKVEEVEVAVLVVVTVLGSEGVGV